MKVLRLSWLSLVTLCASAAHADSYDFQIYKLGNPQKDATGYDKNADANFRAFARMFGAAMASVNLAPPETLGHSGFLMAAELSVVDFGTGASGLPTHGDFKGPMLVPSLHVRKGLPSSFELGARGAWFERSRMGAGTIELKWAINEGFTYLPDIGVRGVVSKLMNGRDFDLTVGGLDIGIGKQFALGGMVTITPYAGWNLLFVGASTGNVDFNPGRSLAASDSSTDQFKDFYVFSGVMANANSLNRFYGGLRFIGGVVQLGAEFSYTVLGTFQDAKTGEKRDQAGVMAFNSTLGLDF